MIMQKTLKSAKLTKEWIDTSATLTKNCLMEEVPNRDVDWDAIYSYEDHEIVDFLLAEQSFLNAMPAYMLGVSDMIKLPRDEITVYRDLQGKIFAVGRTDIMGDSFGQDYRATSEDELVRMIISILHEGILYIGRDIQDYIAVPAMDFLIESYTDQAIMYWYTQTVPNEFLTKLFNIGKLAAILK